MSNYLWLPIWATAAIAVASALGVFRFKKVLGRPRLSFGESPLVILRIIGLAMLTWAVCGISLGAIHQERLKQQGKPATSVLSENETVIFGGITELAILMTMVVATIVTRNGGLRQTGINLRRIPAGFLGGILGIAIVLPLIFYINVIVAWGLNHWKQPNPPHELLEILKNHPSAWLRAADVISAGLVAPIAEEMFFRGLLLTLLRNVFNSSWPAIFFSALAFALVHHWSTWPQIFFLGCCLGYAYERSGNLWVSITMHAMFNLTSIWLFTHWG
jgi:membrane protease YdiL (CAAX protease family)